MISPFKFAYRHFVLRPALKVFKPTVWPEYIHKNTLKIIIIMNIVFLFYFFLMPGRKFY